MVPCTHDIMGDFMKRLVILGASGSIGTQTIDIVLQHPDMFSVRALGVGRNIKVLEEILAKVDVDLVSVANKEDAEMLGQIYRDKGFFNIALGARRGWV